MGPRFRIPVPGSLLVLLTVALQACGAGPHVQEADSGFDPIVREPAGAGRDLRVLVDEAHDNFHTVEGRYRPLAELLRGDGFTVEPGREPFSAESLAGYDLLVIANASPADPERPTSAFTDAEIAAVVEWVEEGRGLLLVADHTPYGAAARRLGEAFGVVMHDAHLRDPDHADPVLGSPFILVFDRSEGRIGDHPITRGRGEAERIERVVTFGGQALEAPLAATPLLLLADTAEIVERSADGEVLGVRSAAGAVQALALRHGRGRVVVMGEAAALTSQVIRGQVASELGREELRLGMSRTDTDNRQLVLNIARWLGQLLPSSLAFPRLL